MRIPAFSFLLTILLEITSISGHLEDDYNYFRRPLLQDLVTWDERSFFIRGERMMLYSGEFHPFRLPVPGLWLDVFQKIKAMGFNTVSFYTDWGLLEGTPGRVLMNGIFSLEPFFKAASEAGIYLIARPGPYINAETTAGGFPGWTLRINGTLRSTSPNFLNATENYVSVIGKIVAKAQITNGGPVILVQPENEYGSWPGVSASTFPNQMNREYISYVNQQYRDTGIVVPFINNDNYAIGSFAPGTGLGEVDIYGIDAYPMRYDCANPNIWPTYRWPEGWNRAHIKHSPTTPFAIPEFQGGSGTSWEGVNQDMCNELVNEEAVRVFHKHTYSFGVKLLNIYMTFGGTNWGNLGFMGGDTSYDYGAAISENRQVFREKYSETKLQANFFKVSPAYLTSVSGDASNTAHTNSSAITVTPLIDSESKAQFLIVRHAEFTSRANTSYELIVTTMIGNFTIPQLGGHLSLQGRDSKIHVIDYNVGGIRLVYSTAEILSWAKSKAGTTVLLVYGGFGETHEIMVATQNKPRISEGSGIKVSVNGVGWVLEWDVVPQRRIVVFEQDKLEIHLLWRNDAYNHWILELPLSAPVGNYSSPSKAVVIVRGGHLMRHAEISGNELRLIGDVNATTDLEIIYEPTEMMNRIVFNEVLLDTAVSPAGKLRAAIDYVPPDFPLPDFARLPWAYLDSLPELQSSYDDSLWTSCNHTTTTNPKKLKTPISLYASDYGYHSGSLIYRGHFFSHGNESYFTVTTAGGFAFAHSIWLNNKFVKSWTGRNANQSYSHVIALPPGLQPGQSQVITILIDHMGQDEEAPGTDSIKAPLGILGYSLSGHHDSDITWKMTGNFGGEDYQDLVRGPRNEGAMFAERQGFHLPNPPSSDWTISNPIHDGISKAGVGFFTTSFELHVPAGYDVPMNFLFAESVKRNEVKGFNSTNYRCQLFVNGYQFGKYISNLGPQNKFPVPEGILNYNGTNWVAVSLWALDEGGARLGTFMLEADRPVMSGYQRPDLAPQPRWERRKGAY